MLRRLVAHIRSDEISNHAPYKIVIGLGNPGIDYEASRHNAGFMIVDELRARQTTVRSADRFGATIFEYTHSNKPVIIGKPLTFMNRSGVSVVQIVAHYKIAPANLLVVYDELDLPFGRIQLRPGGSAGGHNGMKSVLHSLGTQEVARLRFGIGRPVKGTSIDYVLGPFDEDQELDLPTLLSHAGDAVELWLQHGIQRAMNEYNQKPTVVPMVSDSCDQHQSKT